MNAIVVVKCYRPRASPFGGTGGIATKLARLDDLFILVPPPEISRLEFCLLKFCPMAEFVVAAVKKLDFDN